MMGAVGLRFKGVPVYRMRRLSIATIARESLRMCEVKGFLTDRYRFQSTAAIADVVYAAGVRVEVHLRRETSNGD
jgi:hypothetical protein